MLHVSDSFSIRGSYIVRSSYNDADMPSESNLQDQLLLLVSCVTMLKILRVTSFSIVLTPSVFFA